MRMPPTGILHTEMDEETLLEIEIQQDLERLNLDDNNIADIDDDDDLEVNNNGLLPQVAEDGGMGPEHEGVPVELQDYINTIQKQRERFEEELQECDTLIDRALSTVQGEVPGDEEKRVVVYNDWKELEEEAARHGMTAEDYRKKLLQDLENEPFELEEMDFLTDDSEFVLPESALDQVMKTADTSETGLDLMAPHPLLGGEGEGEEEMEPSAEDQMIEKALSIARAMEAEQGRQSRAQGESRQLVPVGDRDPEQETDMDPHPLLPVGGGGGGGGATSEDADNGQDGSHDAQGPGAGSAGGADTLQEAAGAGVGPSAARDGPQDDQTDVGAVAVVHINPLQEFEQYLREQFQLAEERFRQREQQLQQELEGRRAAEERLMLAMEEQKLSALHTLQEEEQRLAQQKQESQKKLEQEIEKKQKVLEKELKQHEEAIATLTAQLEEDRYQLEKVQRAEDERVAQRNDKAAITVQRYYRGYRARRQHQAEGETLAERREQRKEEKQQQRIQQVEQQIQERKDEEERKAQEIRRVKEEKEREIEEEKRKREEEEQRKKEEEAERKKKAEEEKKRKAEEERRRKEEEDRRVKEEQERKKQEEERKRREEEERKKREEEEEERKRKEEEEKKKKKEEEKRRKEEEERKQKAEEERKHKEEEEQKRKEEEEERKKQEEEKQRLEEERKRKEEQEKQRTEEEARKATERKGGEERKAEPGKMENNSEHRTNDTPNKSAETAKSSVTNEGRQSRDCENGHSVSPLVFDLEPVNANILPNSLEERRLAWMKSCLPWSKISNEPWKQKSGAGEKVPRRPASAKKLSPLPENLILEAAQVASLRQVTTVELKDLPGHALSPLGACGQLKHLTLTGCGLIALDGLTNCKHLHCVSVQNNLIEYVDLKELNNLHTLNLSHNKLSSIHGLDGCTNLRWLDVSHNRLTKLGGLSPLRRLHTLQASHNQLVSSKGLEACPTLQQLDLSANYLTSLQGLARLGLLMSLNLASNNLTQMPSLENNVLLQELVLRENSIGPDVDLSAAWLPLLSCLDLSQNIIEQLTGSAGGLFVLKRLDLAVNQIADTISLLPALSDCPRLEDLSLQGNAVLDDDNLRDNLKNSLPCLLCLNGETVRSQVSGPPTRCFELMCLNQLHSHRDLKNAFNKECRSVPEEGKRDSQHHHCHTRFKFCDRSFRMAVEHRYAHEYGELTSTNVPAPPQTPKSQSHSRPTSARTPRAAAARTSAPAPANSASTVGKETTVSGSQGRSPDLHSSSSAVAAAVAVPPEKTSAWRTADHDDDDDDAERNGGVWDSKGKAGAGAAAAAAVGAMPSSSPVLSQKEKFDLALRAEAESQSQFGAGSGGGGGDGGYGGRRRTSDHDRDLDHDHAVLSDHGGRDGLAVGQPLPPSQPQLSAKEKFERALAGLPTSPSELPPVTGPQPPSSSSSSSLLPHNNGLSGASERTVTNHHLPPMKPGGITADMVGGLMMAESAGLSRSPLPNKLLEGDLDDLDDLDELMEGLQFDLDGFLDLDQFDFDEDFLEKGWRPEDSPQIPQKIPPTHHMTTKPPLPPLQTTPTPTNPHSPAPPPGRPAQAWRTGGSETSLSDLQTRLVPPLLRPPSSVGSGEDSQAATTGRNKREERLAEEWGFKNSRTAELMMQRANKMKYNAERRRKISKLDPQQRLQLFRKLKEAKGVHAVRPPLPRVLPRKEYFQAREEEAYQRDMERQMEYKTRAGRTFEWLHTQVGEFDVSSSRINPGGGAGAVNSLMKTASDSQLSHHPSPSPHGHSPMSLEVESVGGVSSQQQAVRPHRHSLGAEDLTLTGHSPMLPPIKTGSAPSQHSREREKMSWRTEPMERSGGWGGGKKRQVRK